MSLCSYDELLEKIHSIDPVNYSKTRNFTNGAVSRLSPYVSRGVISTRQMMESALDRGYSIANHESFFQQLAWRDYFQRLLQVRPDLYCVPIKLPQIRVASTTQLPSAIINGETGIWALDQAIDQLYNQGWVHNHLRMYLAMLVCNIAHCSWQAGGKWMYFHLLDADVASNFASWQWVAGSNSSKKYIANQENINKYTLSNQRGTFLDRPYETFESMPELNLLQQTQEMLLQSYLPSSDQILINENEPTFVYTLFNLDPNWHSNEPGNRILLIEPSFMHTYPNSKKVMDFVIDLARNIPNIQVAVMEFKDLQAICKSSVIKYKEHPLMAHFSGVQEERSWMFPSVEGYYPSFFAYWKACLKTLKKR